MSTSPTNLNLEDGISDDERIANLGAFLSWLTMDAPGDAEAIATHVTSTMHSPFAVVDPRVNHNSYGVTWNSTSKTVTQAGTAELQHLNARMRSWARETGSDVKLLPRLDVFFHQGGFGNVTGYQYFEMFGERDDVARRTCEAIVAWLPGHIAARLRDEWY